MCAKVSEEGSVYVMTPETPFTPSVALRENKNAVYKLGSTMLKTESRNMEYKLGGGNYIWNILPEHLMKYGSAFLNSGGGTLCIGVNDNGVVYGVQLHPHDKERLRMLIKREFAKFTPKVEEDLYEVDLVPCNRLNFFVIEIHVRAGDPAEIYSDGQDKMYVKRDGSVQGPLWPRAIKEIVEDKIMKGLIREAEAKTLKTE